VALFDLGLPQELFDLRLDLIEGQGSLVFNGKIIASGFVVGRLGNLGPLFFASTSMSFFRIN
jgi:hypothetical protein